MFFLFVTCWQTTQKQIFRFFLCFTSEMENRIKFFKCEHVFKNVITSLCTTTLARAENVDE
jgi:hypothetical protein